LSNAIWPDSMLLHQTFQLRRVPLLMNSVALATGLNLTIFSLAYGSDARALYWISVALPRRR
jgi:hypothetical protein